MGVICFIDLLLYPNSVSWPRMAVVIIKATLAVLEVFAPEGEGTVDASVDAFGDALLSWSP